MFKFRRITGRKNGVEVELLMFVPLGAPAEIHRVVIRNRSAVTKKLQLYSLLEWCLWNASTDMENFQRNFSTGDAVYPPYL